MQKTLWLIALVLIAALAPMAHADTITDGTINFTVTGGNVSTAPTGSFVYDNTTGTFTYLTIIWDGGTYDFSSLANSLAAFTQNLCSGPGIYIYLTTGCNYTPNPFSFQWVGHTLNPPGSGAVFGFESSGVTWPGDIFSPLATSPGVAFGDFTVTTTVTVVTPEPGTLVLMLAGVGLMAFVVWRKGVPLGHSEAS